MGQTCLSGDIVQAVMRGQAARPGSWHVSLLQAAALCSDLVLGSELGEAPRQELPPDGNVCPGFVPGSLCSCPPSAGDTACWSGDGLCSEPTG